RDTLAAFPAAGYYVLRSGWRAEGLPYQQASHVVFDCGPVGRGNHGHLDALSFEYFAGGQALVVDPGRCTYDESGEQNWRVRFRGTAAHNTVEVDGRDQTRYEYVEKYGKFRLTGRGAECELHHVLEGPGGKLVSASVHSHEYTAVHRRDLFLAAAGYLLIVDRLHDAVPRDYALRFQLAPAAQGQVQLTSGDAGVSVTAPGLVLHQLAVPRAVMTVEPSWVAPTYGERLPAPRLRSDVRATRATFVTVLAPDTLSALTLTALHAPAGVVAVRVEHAGGADVCCYAPSGAAHPLVYAGIGCEAEFAHFTSAAGGPARLTMTDVSAAVAIHGETGR
ncbi:MAG: heparinase II/III-family protein, partial [Gammaproteobacteria bacterium]